MLSYAVDRRPSGRTHSPRALLLIAAGHAVLIAAVMAAKIDLPGIVARDPTKVTFVPLDPPPPPEPQPRTEPRHSPSTADRPITLVPLPPFEPVALDDGPPLTGIDPVAGTDDPVVLPPADPPRTLVRKAARFATPSGGVRPPYPEAKRRMAEEASLRLALEIDSAGRVVAVEPVGPADPVFLDAARRHILKRWRYQPAVEGGDKVASRTVVTLRFELDR